MKSVAVDAIEYMNIRERVTIVSMNLDVKENESAPVFVFRCKC